MMESNAGYENYLRVLDQKQVNVQDHLRRLRTTLVKDNAGDRLEAAGRALAAIGELATLLDAKKVPPWLDTLTTTIGQIKERHQQNDQWKHADEFLQNLSAYQDQIFSKRLSESDQKPSGIDFDALFKQAYDASRIPELFDRLIDLLKQVIDSDQIERVKVIRELETLVAMLRKNRNSSYFSTHSTYQVVSIAVRKLLYHIGEDTPVLGTIVKAVKGTMEELDIEWHQVESNAIARIKGAFPYALPGIERSLPSSKALPGPIEGELMDAEENSPNGPKPPSTTHTTTRVQS